MDTILRPERAPEDGHRIATWSPRLPHPARPKLPFRQRQTDVISAAVRPARHSSGSMRPQIVWADVRNTYTTLIIENGCHDESHAIGIERAFKATERSGGGRKYNWFPGFRSNANADRLATRRRIGLLVP